MENGPGMNDTAIKTLRAPHKAPFPVTVARKTVWVRSLSGVLPIYLVNEYPKSGGTWMKNLLAAALEVPAWTRTDPVWSTSVMQGHWLNPFNLHNVVALFRDGRDVMVSYYHHSFFRNEQFNSGYVDRMRERFGFSDYEDVRSNLLPFMKTMLTDPPSPGFTWVDFVEKWAQGPAKVSTRYEWLRRDTATELQRIVRELTGRELAKERAEAIADKFSLSRMRARMTKEAAGKTVEKSFVREGSVGGWSRHFTDEALDWFEKEAGHALDLLGYPRGRPDPSSTLISETPA